MLIILLYKLFITMSNKHTIKIEQYSKQGELQPTYSPLQNMLKDGEISHFSTSEISYDLKNFVGIETQLSYDDSINLILNNNDESPRIINTQFRKLGNNRYEYLTRNQSISTNLYDESTISSTTDLFLRSNIWPIIDLINVGDSGQLMGGNYVFYIKYCDEDFNESEIVSESGIVSIFHGTLPTAVHGALVDERTNKHIELKITNVDPAFKTFYLYYSRDTSDLNGISLTKYYKLTSPITLTEQNSITITGYENVEEISRDTLFIKYNYFTAAKTHAVTQNMLFLGNVHTSEKDHPSLQQISYKIGVTLKQKDTSIGYISGEYSGTYNKANEYYNPKNIYYYLGYWPDEYYSLGICYILNDGSVTNSFSLYGGILELNQLHTSKTDEESLEDWADKKYEVNTILGKNNTGGVFKLPKIEVIDHVNQTVKPLYFEFSFQSIVLEQLKKLNVIGYFFTRTKRVPISLFQGFSVGIDDQSGIPMPYVSSGVKVGYIAESFLNKNNGKDEDNKTEDDKIKNRMLSDSVDNHLRSYKKDETKYHALLSVDPMVNPQLQSMLSWNEYELQEEYQCTLEGNTRERIYNITSYIPNTAKLTSSLAYIEKDIPAFYIDDKYFSTRAGAAESVREIEFLGGASKYDKTEDNILRGVYCPIIGSGSKLMPSTIYTVKNKINNENSWISTLVNINNPYFAITNRIKLDDTIADNPIIAYRGDCFTSTVTIRINRNFIDPTVPSNDLIVDEFTWNENYKGINSMISTEEVDKEELDEKIGAWVKINLSDVNAVPLGIWVTFKCLSNYNLGLRSEDTSDVGLLNRIGGKGSFYPISSINVKASGKVAESQLLNDGYSVTLSRNAHTKWSPVPYENWNFENRIAFSNIASTKMFTNGFRVFQGLAYQDIDKQFGQIIKLFPYGQNLLCVFEHGLAIIPINEKALLSTQEGLSIHLYGAGVLQEQVSVISPDYGSTWMESLIKTPNAYYGVDTNARKIWKFNNAEGFVCISDFKIQSFLNEELTIDWNDKFFMGATNVRTHYNNFKGDVIFTFYKGDKAYSICYNELTKTWISRYTWMPLLTANIDNHLYSFNRNQITTYANLYQQTLKSSGITCDDPFYKDGVIFRYSGLKTAKLKLKSVTYDDKIFEVTDNSNVVSIIYIDSTEDGDEEITYTAELIYDEVDNSYKFTIPLDYVNSAKVKLQATITMYEKEELLEEYEFTISNDSPLAMYLYQHDINSKITNWYNNQEPFEYEFIVNQPAGFHKIFNNLMIISNNVEPDSLEIEIVGDSYDFKEEFIKQTNENIKYKFPIISLPKNKIYQTKLTLDKVTNENRLVMHQDCLNIKDFGRRLGNISYIEGKWYVVLQPIYYEDKTLKTTRLRDKWAKIRIKYSGEKLAIITAIQTLMNISYV